MKRPLIMVIDDEGDTRVHDVKMARAKEHHERTTAMHALMQSGDVTVMEDMDPAIVRVRVDDEFFTDKRDAFPSTQLLARVQLAIHAGRSDRVRQHKEAVDRHLSDAMVYGISMHSQMESRVHRRRVGKSEILAMGYGDGATDRAAPMEWYDAMEIAHHNTAQITATVKPKNLRKGLRP